MQGTNKRREDDSPTVPHVPQRPQSCDPDVISSRLIPPLSPFWAGTVRQQLQLPPKSPANLGTFSTWPPATDQSPVCLRTLDVAWICHPRHCASLPADRPQHQLISIHLHASLISFQPLPTIPPSHHPHVRHKGDAEGRDKTSHL